MIHLNHFPVFQGTLPWQPFLGQNWQINLHLACWRSERHYKRECYNADLRVNIGDNPAKTSFRNLVSFRPVTTQFTMLNLFQQASISTRVLLN